MVGKGSINNFPASRERKVLSVSLDISMIETIKKEASRRGKKISHIVEEALHQYIYTNHLYTGPEPTKHIKELQAEISELAGKLHIERAKNRALGRELTALRRVNYELMITLNDYVKSVVTAKKETASIHTKKLELDRKEVILKRKEQELKEREKEIERREKELNALAKHLDEKEERLLRWEKMLRAKILSKRAPELVKEILEEEELKAIGMRELLNEYDWEIFFGKEEIKKAIEVWEIIEENGETITRKTGKGLVYRHLKHNPLAGFFQLRGD